jgi:MFS family permease
LPRRSVIVAGVLLWSLATVASGLATDFGQLLLCRVCVGIGEAALAPAAASMIVDTFAPARRGTAVGLFLMGQVIGGGAALAIGGYLLDLAVAGDLAWLPWIGALAPWRAVLVLVGLPGLIVAVLLLSVAEPVRRREKRSQGAARALPLSAVAQGFRARAGLLVPLYLANALVSIGDYGLLAWSPAFLSRNFDFAPAMIGTVLGGIAIVTGIVGTAGGGYLADRLSRRFGAPARLKLVFIASLIGMLGACVGLMPTASGVLLALTLWMLASAVSGTVAIAVVLESLPNDMRGVGTSLVAFCNTILGLGLGPTLVAAATEHVFVDPTAVGLAMTLVSLPASLLAVGLFYRALRVPPLPATSGTA